MPRARTEDPLTSVGGKRNNLRLDHEGSLVLELFVFEPSVTVGRGRQQTIPLMRCSLLQQLPTRRNPRFLVYVS